jgi:hypothetical protein
MNSPSLSWFQTSVVKGSDPADDVDYKDVYFPDLGSEQAVIPLATTAFRAAGYKVRQAEKAAYQLAAVLATFQLASLSGFCLPAKPEAVAADVNPLHSPRRKSGLTSAATGF